MGRRVLRRVLRRGSKKGLSRRHLEGRSTPFREYDPLGVCPSFGGSGEHLTLLLLVLQTQHNEATVAVLTVSAVMAVSVMTAPPLKLNPAFPWSWSSCDFAERSVISNRAKICCDNRCDCGFAAWVSKFFFQVLRSEVLSPTPATCHKRKTEVALQLSESCAAETALCTATFAFLQCGCHFTKRCAATNEKLHCNTGKAALQESGAF